MFLTLIKMSQLTMMFILEEFILISLMMIINSKYET